MCFTSFSCSVWEFVDFYLLQPQSQVAAQALGWDGGLAVRHSSPLAEPLLAPPLGLTAPSHCLHLSLPLSGARELADPGPILTVRTQ